MVPHKARLIHLAQAGLLDLLHETGGSVVVVDMVARAGSPADHKLRNGGETAIVEWLAERIAGTDRAVIVLCENSRVPTIVRTRASAPTSTC